MYVHILKLNEYILYEIVFSISENIELSITRLNNYAIYIL